MMTTKELAERWNIAEGTLANWRSQKRGPKFMRLGRKVVYKADAIAKFEKISAVSLTRSAPVKNRKGRTAKAKGSKNF